MIPPPILKSRYGLLAILLSASLIVYLVSLSLPRGAVAYSLRPLWDRTEAPSLPIPHYYSDKLDDQRLCQLHGWETRNDSDSDSDSNKRQVWDATIFSTELDLLLIRLHELDNIVDKFFLLDSDTTFTGHPKPRVLPRALETAPFAPFRDKIIYNTFKGHELEKGEDPFHQEGQMRMQMTTILKQHLPSDDRQPPPIMVFSDLDEIPRRTTVELLKKCEFPVPMHLGMRSFLYSFEWEEGGEAESWRPQAWIWNQRGNGPEEFYRHGKATDRILVDSGWHCSFVPPPPLSQLPTVHILTRSFVRLRWCFRSLSEFTTKAQGYSHVDRLGSRPSALLRPSRIQETICQGLDMFSMLPEAYTYRDFIMKLKLIPYVKVSSVCRFRPSELISRFATTHTGVDLR